MSLSVINTVARTPHRYVLRPRKQTEVKSSGFDHLAQETRPQTTISLVSLPTELLTEIISFMTWKDILHLRATNKCLWQATKTRAIWSNLVSDHITTTPCPPLLELPISFYDSRELERLYLLWKSAEIGWSIPDVKPRRERLISVEPITLVHLVKGGRWLLVTSIAGGVTYYDLDAKTITGTSLISDQMTACRGNRICVSIDIKQDSPILSFNIGFALTDSSHPTYWIPSQIRIWHISLIVDESRHAVGLTARLLASFPNRPVSSEIMGLTLLGPNIAFSAITFDSAVRVYIINWTLADGTESNMYPWKIIEQVSNTAYLQLLPHNKLLVCQNGSLLLYNYSDICKTQCPSGNDPEIYTAPCHSLWYIHTLSETAEYTLACSHLDQDLAHFRLVSDGRVQSIEINTTSYSNAHPPFLKLTSKSARFAAITCVGHNHAYTIKPDRHSASLVHYVVSNEDSHKLASSARRHLSHEASCGIDRRPLMDERSGRVVHFIPVDKSKLVVVDFALTSPLA